MQPTKNSNRHSPPQAGAKTDRLMVMSWGVGIMTGMAASAFVAMVAVALGYLSFGTPSADARVGLAGQPLLIEVSLTPTPPILAAQALTDSVSLAGLASATPAPPTATPDLAATATQACSLFRSNFPGTPCPRSSTPTSAP